MSKTATLTQGYAINGDGLSASDSVTMTNLTASAPTSISFTGAGFQAITIPAGANGVRIVPQGATVVALTLKGITGDIGFSISSTGPTTLNWTGASSPTIGIAAGAAIMLLLEWC